MNVSADRVIECGEEITNSYINHTARNRSFQKLSAAALGGDKDNTKHQLDDLGYLNSKLTKKQRHRELRQYLFVCECPLCQREEVDSDEDSNDSYSMA